MDRVDMFSQQWRTERPDLNVRPLEMWGRLKRATALYDRAMSAVLDRYELTIAEFEVLAALRRAGPPYQLRPGELTRSLVVTPGAVTNRLDVLERRGLIARLRHADDRRGLIALLTAKGLTIFDPALDAVAQECDMLLSVLSNRQSTLLRESLRALLTNLDDLGTEPIPATRDTATTPA